MKCSPKRMKMMRNGGPSALAATAVGDAALRHSPIDSEQKAVSTTTTRKKRKRSYCRFNPILQYMIEQYTTDGSKYDVIITIISILLN